MQGKVAPGFRKRRPALAGCALLVVLGMLAGCTTTGELPPSEARIGNPADAVIIPPPGGPGIVSLVTTTFPNAVRQDIHLATEARTAGENKIQVILFSGRGGDGGDARLRDVPFTNVNLTQEALAAWPGTGMAVSPYYVQNAYGPFGYAIGKPSNGDTCIYAWQRIEPTLRPSGAVDRGTIVIRLQLCRRGVTEQQLLEVMYNLRLDVSVFPPGRAPASIGALAAPIRPIDASGFAEVIKTGPVRSVPTRSATPAPAPIAPTPPAVPVPAPGAPIVPLPGGSGASGGGPVVPAPPASSVRVPSPTGGSS